MTARRRSLEAEKDDADTEEQDQGAENAAFVALQETEAQALYLRGRGVVMAQGFLFAPALKVGAFKELARALNGGSRAVQAATMQPAAA